MITYENFRPTPLDTPGLALDDRQDWLVAPVTRNRDSSILEESNWDQSVACMEAGGIDPEDWEVHSFNHWASGWIEVMIVRPNSKAFEIAQEIEDRLNNYPALNDEDYSRREFDAYVDSWKQYGCEEFINHLEAEFGLTEESKEILQGIDRDDLRSFFEAHVDYPYEGASDGVYVHVDGFGCEKNDLDLFIKSQVKVSVHQ